MKKYKEKVEILEGREFVEKTIVGGRPLRKQQKRISIPAGIEKVLFKSAIDPEFRNLLMADRIKAIESAGINLLPSEILILKNVSESALRTMTSRIKPKKHGRRKLMKAIATAVVTLATGTASVGCDEVSGNARDTVEIDHESIITGGEMYDIPDERNDEIEINNDMDVNDTKDTVEIEHESIIVGGEMYDLPDEEEGIEEAESGEEDNEEEIEIKEDIDDVHEDIEEEEKE